MEVAPRDLAGHVAQKLQELVPAFLQGPAGETEPLEAAARGGEEVLGLTVLPGEVDAMLLERLAAASR